MPIDNHKHFWKTKLLEEFRKFVLRSREYRESDFLPNCEKHLNRYILHLLRLQSAQELLHSETDNRFDLIADIYECLKSFQISDSDGTISLTESKKTKRNQGLFYTPPELASYIVDRAIEALRPGKDISRVKVIDPAVGTGRFLVAALHKLANVGPSAQSPKTGDENLKKTIAADCLFGVDLDPIAITIARHHLASICDADPDDLSSNLKVGNALVGEILRPMVNKEFALSPKECSEAKEFVWSEEFPLMFDSSAGFDLVIGNPPYEVLSVKESGLTRRTWEQDYYRNHYRCCSGKINLYRLMLERSLALLKPGGVLGFLIPATFLSDTTASKIRKVVLQDSEIIEATLIPEKSPFFQNIVQELLILIVKKGHPTKRFALGSWYRYSDKPLKGPEITLEDKIFDSRNCRIPIIKDELEKKLFELLEEIPPLSGDLNHSPVATIRQGEINITVYRQWLSTQKTGYPLIRGEHIRQFHLDHPAKPERLDWVQSELCERKAAQSTFLNKTVPWENERIGVGRVVNLHTKTRLKAALVRPGMLMGDMTNYLTDLQVPVNFLLGILNSRLLNLRIKLTSTNNYISAAELGALPVPRFDWESFMKDQPQNAIDLHEKSIDCTSLERALTVSHRILPEGIMERAVSQVIAASAELLSNSPVQKNIEPEVWNLLDACILRLYGAEFALKIIEAH